MVITLQWVVGFMEIALIEVKNDKISSYREGFGSMVNLSAAL